MCNCIKRAFSASTCKLFVSRKCTKCSCTVCAMLKGSKLKDKNDLKSWMNVMRSRLKSFIEKFEINKTHFLHEITDTRNNRRINLAFSLYQQLKKRERVITQLTLPFTVMLNDELKSH